MDSLMVYLLQASAGTVLLYLVYFLFYRNDTFYRRNRIILLLIMVLPAVIPVLKFNSNHDPGSMADVITVFDRLIISGMSVQESISENMVSFSTLAFWFWITGVLFFTTRTVTGLVGTLLIIKRGETRSDGNMKIIISDGNHQPFSFCSSVVIPRKLFEERDCEKVMIHEMVHITQFHTFDLIVSEIFIALFWFNPAAWLIRKSIVLNHEYLADSAVISRSDYPADYQFEILSIPADLRNVPFAHDFASNLKNRIVMINKIPTRKFAGFKNLILIPAVTVLLLLFSFKPESVLRDFSQKQELLSPESQQKLMQFIFRNIQYPTEAKNANITGRFYVIVNMGRGGKVGKVYTNRKDKIMKIPMINENDVVVTGYGSSDNTSGQGSFNTNLLVLENEAVRVAKMLGSLELPEWKEKKMEFAFSIDFQLKTRPAGSEATVENPVNDEGTNPLIVVDGTEKPYETLKTLDVSSIAGINVLKGQSAINKYGEKARNGVIEITLKL